MGFLQTLGIGFEGLGLLVTMYGLHARYAEFAPEGSGAFDPAMHAVRRVIQRIVQSIAARVRSLLRRPPKIVVATGSAHVTAGGSIRARGRVGFGPLPTGRSNKPALAELDRRTRDLLERVSDARDAVEDEAARIDDDIAAVSKDLQAEAQELREQIRRLATGDVALQYVGLVMIAAGLILQGIGLAVGG